MTPLHCLETRERTKSSRDGKYDSMFSRSSFVSKTARRAESRVIKRVTRRVAVFFESVVFRFYPCSSVYCYSVIQMVYRRLTLRGPPSETAPFLEGMIFGVVCLDRRWRFTFGLRTRRVCC